MNQIQLLGSLYNQIKSKAGHPPPHFFWKNFSFGRSKGDREIMYKVVADPWEGPRGGGGGDPPPLFFDQTEARRAEKKI